MSLTTGKMLGISITLESKKKILEEIEKYLIRASSSGHRITEKKQGPMLIVTPNPEQMVLARHDAEFAKLLNRADIAIPDGVGLVWALKFLSSSSILDSRYSKLKRIPGIELMQDLAALADKRAVRIGLIGGKGELAVRALECLRKSFSGLEGEPKDAPEFKIVQNQLKSPNFDQFLSETVSWIREKNLQIIFVGLGAPKQELLIEELVRRLSLRSASRRRSNLAGDRHDFQSRDDMPIVLMSVGGSFDILAGRVSRAPLLMRLMGFEWLWRLLREPWRWRRQLALVEFVLHVLRAKFRSIAK